MKRLGRVLGNLLAVALTVFSMQALAETQLGGRDFNHMTTGFPLTGGHAAAACETCHMGGVFKGLPRTCDGCHQAGQRIVATPKSNSHIVTDAPCETCHFNTSTWLGARFNHGTARVGQCSNCHNGRISTGKPANTAVGMHPLTTESCDKCHRASAWVPASWNHNGVTGDCSTCHRAAGPGRGFNAATHMSQATMSAMNIATCAACHKNFYSFLGAYYDHAGAGIACGTCHDNPGFAAAVKSQKVSPKHTGYVAVGITDCHACHKSYAIGSFPSGRFDHSGSGASPACSGCHDGTSVVGKIAGHITTIDECSQCHFSTAAWLPALGGKPANHIPYNAGVKCTNCHAGLAKVNAVTLHTFSVATYTCATCHIKPNAYTGNNQNTESSHEGSSGNNCTGCHEHTGAGSYVKW